MGERAGLWMEQCAEVGIVEGGGGGGKVGAC